MTVAPASAAPVAIAAPESLGGSGHDDDSVAEAHRAVKAPSTA